MNKFTQSPQGAKKKASNSSIDNFIEGATKLPNTDSYPWLGLNDTKRYGNFLLRLTEVELSKLQFIAANTPFSMQSFAVQVLTAAIDSKIAELTRSTHSN